MGSGGGRGRWWRSATGMVLLLLALATPVPTVDDGSPAAADPGATASPVATPRVGDGSGLDELADRLLDHRPPLGPAWVVHLGGESTERRLLAYSLQGLVNRTSARLYLIDGGDGGGGAVLDRYVDRGLVTLEGTSDLDGALDRFGSEAGGYVVADVADPGGIHEAMIVASLEGGLVVSAADVADLQARGLTELADVRGHWPDAATAHAGNAAAYRDALPSDTIAVVRPTDSLWDFVYQQGLLPVFTRPLDPTWSAVSGLFEDVPDGSPIYGYLSDTGDEEVVAVATLAADELVLVPTDTTRNLSFHIAVGAEADRVPMPAPALDDVAPCDGSTLDVVIGLSDGDNMNVPLNHFMRPSNWDSSRRGDLALGWSIGPDLAVLAPAMWDTYALEATDRDELVSMIGWGYGAPALLEDPSDFYALSFRAMDDLGMTTFWSLGGGLDTRGSPYWTDLDDAAGDGVPHGVLVGYGNATGSAFHSPAGRPAFTSRSVYSETPADLAAHVEDLLATPVEDRPAVSFLSATNWSNPAHDLIGALAPFEARGVRFLTPAEAAACMPTPEPTDPDPGGPGECRPDGPVTEHGLALISAPAAGDITARPATFDLPITVDAPAAVAPGDVIEHSAVVTVDVGAFAAATLEERVRPIVAAGYGPDLADSAWVGMRFDDLRVRLRLPDHVGPATATTVSSTGPTPDAAWGEDELTLTFPTLATDTRDPGAAFEVVVEWSAVADAATAAHDAVVLDGGTTFDLLLDIGVLLGDIPLVGGIGAPFGCDPAPVALATTAVVPPAPVDPPGPMRPPGPPTTLDPATPGGPGVDGPAPEPGATPGAVPPRRLDAAVPVTAAPRYAG